MPEGQSLANCAFSFFPASFAVSAEHPTLQSQIDKAAVLLEALPYLQEFRGATFLIKVGGSAMDDPERVRRLMRDIVFLEIVGVNPVLVHGGGKAISKAMSEAGLEATFVNGLRITTDEAMDLVERTLSSEINPGLVKMLEDLGGRVVGVAGREILRAERLSTKTADGEEVKLGRVGRVVDFDLAKIEAAIAAETVPVISPIALEEETGLSLNVNADLAAAALAGRLQAAKLVYMSDVLGVMRDPSDEDTLIPTIQSAEVDALISGGVLSGGMIPKVESAVDALHKGVGKVHMVDGRVAHSVLLVVWEFQVL